MNEINALKAQVAELVEALDGLMEIAEVYQDIDWVADHEGDNYDETIENARDTLAKHKRESK